MIGLTRFSLRNRALIALITIFTVLAGFISLTSLRRELIPSIQVPIVGVVAAVPGASAGVVEERVTAPIEAAVLGVEGVEKVQSTSSNSLSAITVNLRYGIDLPQAQAKLQRAVLAVPNLPEGTDPEVIAGSIEDFPVMQIAASGGENTDQLAARIRDIVVPGLKDIEGVREVQVSGVSDKIVRIDLDEKKMDKAGLSASAVSSLLQANGIVVPAGKLPAGGSDLATEVGSRITSVEQLRELPLAATGSSAPPGLGGSLPSAAGSGPGGLSLGGVAGMSAARPRVPVATPTPVACGTRTPTPGATLPGGRPDPCATSPAAVIPPAPAPAAPPTAAATTGPTASPSRTSPPVRPSTTTTPAPSRTTPAPSQTIAPPSSSSPSPQPTVTVTRTLAPTGWPSALPSNLPTALPSNLPTALPSNLPSNLPPGFPDLTQLQQQLQLLPQLPALLTQLQQLQAGLSDLPQLQQQLGDLRQLQSQLARLAQLQGRLDDLAALQGQLAQLQQLQAQLGQLQQLQGQLGQLQQLQGQLGQLRALQGQLGQLQQLQGQLAQLAGLRGQLAQLEKLSRQLQGATQVATPKIYALGDVATVDLVPNGEEGISRSDGEPSVTLSITKTPDGGAVEVSQAVHEALPNLEKSLSDGRFVVVFDQAPFIEQSIDDLTHEGVLGLAMAILVVLFFLMSIPLTLVTALSIPLSLLVALIGLYTGGLTLNILTLGALTIAVGRVVDDSIVVIENIKRHLDLGEDKSAAIPAAVGEVASAITASTIATVAVFLPIGIVGGQAGELFRPFAITVGLAMGASLLVALTIVPVLGYWFIRPAGKQRDSRFARLRRRKSGSSRSDSSDLLQRAYLPTLAFALRRPVATLIAAVLLLAGTGALATQLKTDFIGNAASTTLAINQELPAGSSLATTDDAARTVESIVRARPDVLSHQVTISGGGGGGFEALFGGGSTNIARHTVTVAEDADLEKVSGELRSTLEKRTDIGEVSISEAAGGGPGSSEVEIAVQAADEEDLRTAAAAVQKAVAAVEGARDVKNNLADLTPTVAVTVDRADALRRGLVEPQIGSAVAAAMKGRTIGRVEIDQQRHDVVVRELAAPAGLAALQKVVVGSDLKGNEVRLADVATVERSTAPASISRQDGRRTAVVSAVPEGDDLGGLTRQIQSALDATSLPDGASATIGGVSADQAAAFEQLGLALLVAIAIVYVVMVATFGSLLQPFLLLVSIPFAATGALAALELTDTALGVPAIIGLLMLVGIVVTNAIVLIDLVNQYRRRGASIEEAVTAGARDRVRPIIMTALATILALVPMAASLSGGGAFISQPLALVVIGGLFSSTLLTLVLLPVLYVVVEKALARRSN